MFLTNEQYSKLAKGGKIRIERRRGATIHSELRFDTFPFEGVALISHGYWLPRNAAMFAEAEFLFCCTRPGFDFVCEVRDELMAYVRVPTLLDILHERIHEIDLVNDKGGLNMKSPDIVSLRYTLPGGPSKDPAQEMPKYIEDVFSAFMMVNANRGGMTETKELLQSIISK